MDNFQLDKWCVSYYDSMYLKEVCFYFDELEQAVIYAKEQLQTCCDLLVKIYYQSR